MSDHLDAVCVLRIRYANRGPEDGADPRVLTSIDQALFTGELLAQQRLRKPPLTIAAWRRYIGMR